MTVLATMGWPLDGIALLVVATIVLAARYAAKPPHDVEPPGRGNNPSEARQP